MKSMKNPIMLFWDISDDSLSFSQNETMLIQTRIHIFYKSSDINQDNANTMFL